MSKGPGKLQRAITALIEANPDGAWAYEDLARAIYGRAGRYRAQKSAIGRAFKTMRLPGTWKVDRFGGDRRWWLCDPCSHASMRKVYPSWHDPAHFQPGGMYFKDVEKAKRYRDATPLERVEMDLADAHSDMGRAKHPDFQEGDPAEVAERIERLKARKAEMLAVPASRPSNHSPNA